MKKTPLLLLSLVLALAFVVSCGASKSSSAAPDFTMTGVDGKPIKLSDMKGKVVILDFWATWCPPCKMEIPDFIALQDKYGKDGLIIVGAALDEPDKVKQFYSDYKMNYPVGIADQSMAMSYGGIRGIPTTFVIDKKGNVARKYVGFRPKEVFEADFLKLK